MLFRSVAPSGVTARAVADVRRLSDTTVVRLDSLQARTSGNSWASQRRTVVAIDRQGFRFDSLVLAGERGGRIAASGRASAGDTVGATLRFDDVPLADIGELLQTGDVMAGRLSMRADVRGTKRRPDLFFTGRMVAANVGGFSIGDVDADGRYADRRLTTSLAMRRGSAPALHADASLPLDLAFQPEGPRFLEEPLTARVRTDSATLGLLEAFLPSVRDASGALRVDLDVSGTWKHPRATGSLAVTGGALALRPMGFARIEGLDADIAFLGDSVAIQIGRAHV